MYGGGVMPVRQGQVQCQEPKTGQQKAHLYYEVDPLCPSRYIIYLWLQHIPILVHVGVI